MIDTNSKLKYLMNFDINGKKLGNKKAQNILYY
jgi:hypothetical protein